MAQDPGTKTITLELTEQFPGVGCYYGRSDARFTEMFQVEGKRAYEIVLRMVEGPAADVGH